MIKNVKDIKTEAKIKPNIYMRKWDDGTYKLFADGHFCCNLTEANVESLINAQEQQIKVPQYVADDYENINKSELSDYRKLQIWAGDWGWMNKDISQVDMKKLRTCVATRLWLENQPLSTVLKVIAGDFEVEEPLYIMPVPYVDCMNYYIDEDGVTHAKYGADRYSTFTADEIHANFPKIEEFKKLVEE